MDNLTDTIEAYKLLNKQWNTEKSYGTPEGASLIFDAMSAIFRYHQYIKDWEIKCLGSMIEEKQITCSHHGYEVLLNNMWMCRDCCQVGILEK